MSQDGEHGIGSITQRLGRTFTRICGPPRLAQEVPDQIGGGFGSATKMCGWRQSSAISSQGHRQTIEPCQDHQRRREGRKIRPRQGHFTAKGPTLTNGGQFAETFWEILEHHFGEHQRVHSG